MAKRRTCGRQITPGTQDSLGRNAVGHATQAKACAELKFVHRLGRGFHRNNVHNQVKWPSMTRRNRSERTLTSRHPSSLLHLARVCHGFPHRKASHEALNNATGRTPSAVLAVKWIASRRLTVKRMEKVFDPAPPITRMGPNLFIGWESSACRNFVSAALRRNDDVALIVCQVPPNLRRDDTLGGTPRRLDNPIDASLNQSIERLMMGDDRRCHFPEK